MSARASQPRVGGAAPRSSRGGGAARQVRASAAPASRDAAGGGDALHALPPRAAPTCLHVFDFDSTLVDTPLPEAGAAAWLRLTGEPWPHAGWWGRPESLSPLLPSRAGPAMRAYAASCTDAEAVVVLLTGRRAHLASAVRACLALHGAAAFHQQLFNDTRHDTLQFKAAALRRLVGQYGATVRAVHIYEDRAPHAEYFEQLGRQEFPALSWTVHLVVPEEPPAAPPVAGAAPDAVPQRSPLGTAPARSPAPAAASPAEAAPRRLPFAELTHYARLCVPLPAEAACVPPAWRAAKELRDGAWPPAHVTLMSSAEVRAVLSSAAAAPASAAFMQGGTRAAPTPPPEGPASPAEARRALGAAVRRVRAAPLHLRGLGVAVGAAGACAYVVVDWPGGKAFRRWMGLPPADFHATLGFEGEDPHDVRKDRATLLRAPPRGWPPGEAGAAAMQAAVLARAQQLRARRREDDGANGAQQMEL